jgi:hypothetical protein
VVRRGVFADALAWMEIHGHEPALVEQWKAALVEIGNEPADAGGVGAPGGAGGEKSEAGGNIADGQPPFKRKRRRRRRGRRSAPKGNV